MDHRVWDTQWGMRTLAGLLIKMSIEVVTDAMRTNGTDEKRTCTMGREPGLSSGGQLQKQQQWLTKNALGDRKEPGEGGIPEVRRGESVPEEGCESQGQTLSDTKADSAAKRPRICGLGSHQWPFILPGQQRWHGMSGMVTTWGGKRKGEAKERIENGSSSRYWDM